MLTLDALARMARRMPEESLGDGYRRPDPGLRTRVVSLPTPREEARRARGLFALAVGLAAAVLTPTGVLCVHGAALLEGHAPAPGALLTTGAWFLGAALALMVPFAALGLLREVRRFRRARELLGPRAILDASGVLRSEDGERTFRLD